MVIVAFEQNTQQMPRYGVVFEKEYSGHGVQCGDRPLRCERFSKTSGFSLPSLPPPRPRGDT